VFPRLAPALPTYLPILIANIDPVHPSVCNNASWAIGEIA
jgi:transportin-1